jgi:gluconate 2-dehydrogenase gamma chain
LTLTAQLLERTAQEELGRSFASEEANARDRLLARFARGELFPRSAPQRELFVLLHALTLEGFVSDPKHGGNHQGLGWKAVGFEGQNAAHHH